MKLVFCLVAALLLPLSATAQPATTSASTEEEPTNSALDAALFYQLLLSELNAQGGEPGTGYSLMLDAARKTNDPILYQRAVDIALQSRAGEAALQAARAWKQAQPASREASRITLQILIALNRVDEIGDLLAAEIAAIPLPERAAAISMIPRGFLRATDKQQAVRVVERALADHLKRPETGAAAWIAIGRMHLLANNPQGALDAARHAQALNPRLEDAALLAIEVMGPNQPLAEAIVHKYLEAPADPEVRMAYARALLQAQRHAEARVQLQTLTTERPAYPHAWLALGLFQVQDNALDRAEANLKHYLTLPAPADDEATRRARTEALLALAQIAEKRKDYAGAGRWLDQIDQPEQFGVQTRRASLLARQGHMDQARELIRVWPEKTPADTRLKLLTEVQLLRENRQLDTAFDLLGAAIQRQPDDLDLIYDQALIAEKLGKFDDMERLLRQLIVAKPDYHHAYNALGYSLAERNLRLDEARQLITKALQFAPDDPMIRDSQGWVEFRSGNPAEALRILQAAFQSRPDPDIAAHLGEVLWVLGQREQAQALWKQGLQLDPDNDTLAETLKRLQVKP
jgi:tetratricopeptide (TPR) repeat protein